MMEVGHQLGLGLDPLEPGLEAREPGLLPQGGLMGRADSFQLAFEMASPQVLAGDPADDEHGHGGHDDRPPGLPALLGVGLAEFDGEEIEVVHEAVP